MQRTSDDDGRSSSAGSLCCAHPCLLDASEAKMSCHAVTSCPQCAHNWSVPRALRSLRKCVCGSPASSALHALFFWPSHLFMLFHTPLRSISECMVKTNTKALSSAFLCHVLHPARRMHLSDSVFGILMVLVPTLSLVSRVVVLVGDDSICASCALALLD